MKGHYADLRRLRRILLLAGQGMGSSAAIVRVFRSGDRKDRSVARLALLGYPPRVALAPLIVGSRVEVSMLARMVSGTGGTSARSVGERGEQLSQLLETWVRRSDNREMEGRVYRFRGLMISAVLGGVTAMVTGFGPLASSFSLASLTSPAAPPESPLWFLGGALCLANSAALGFFMGGRAALYFAALSLAAFLVVVAAAGPLTAGVLSPVGG